MDLRRLTPDDLPRLRDFWTRHWGGEVMYRHGEAVACDQVEGFVHGDWTGLATFRVRGRECEITSLDSLQPGRGIGSALVEAVLHEARERHCRRLFLVTTNDNLRALGFYQRRGFALAALHRGAVDQSRERKPSIPLVGENGIPLHDEIELELRIEA